MAASSSKDDWVDLEALGLRKPPVTALAFWNSIERAELEVFHRGPLRPTLIMIEFSGYNLRPLVRYIVNRWIHVRKRVRKVFSHYGALLSDYKLQSGRDPCNRIYGLSLIITSMNTLTNDEFWELSRRNLGVSR